MKILFFYALFVCILASCTKSETQYVDQDNKRETVNNRASDTIQTLNQMSDTLQNRSDSAEIETDNENLQKKEQYDSQR
jgi:hypothetical protein